MTRVLTSDLKSTNSRPRQSSSIMFRGLAGSCASYDFGASRMLAECSRCAVLSQLPAARPASLTLQFLQRQTKFASPLLPESSFCSWPQRLAGTACHTATGTHKAVEADPVWVRLPTGSALHFKCVVVRRFFCILRPQICHPIKRSQYMDDPDT